MPTIDLPHATIQYRVVGPERSMQPPVVFVHAFLVGGSVWKTVADLLAEQGIRSYAPDWPLGAHSIALSPQADQTPRGVAQLIARFLEALDLSDVTLVGSDTGGALIQYLLDTDPSRVGRVVLTNCDAFDTFPPPPFSVIFKLLAGPRRMKLNLLPMRARVFRHSALGFGLLAGDLDPELSRSWIEPALTERGVREDASRFLRSINPQELLAVTSRLSQHDMPVRIVWGMADRSFTPELGRRLQQAFRSAEFIEVSDARTFVQLDAPETLADQIASLGQHPS